MIIKEDAMRKSFIAIMLILICIPVLSYAVDYPYPYYPLPEYSRAATFGTLALLQNPAALMENDDLEMMFMHSFNNDTFTGDNTMMMSRNGVGFAYQNYRLSVSPSISAYTLGISQRVARGFYLGTTYTFFKTEDGNPYHNDHFWNVGLIYRNVKNYSLGFVAENLRRMEFGGNDTEIKFTLSMGIRPLPKNLTISADWSWNESEAMSKGFLKGFVHARFKKGWGVFGSIDEDGAFGFGINFAFGYNQIGTSHSYNQDGKYMSGLLYSGYSYRPKGWLLPSKKKVLKLSLDGSYPETEQDIFFWQTKPQTFLNLIENLNRALTDERIGALAVEIKSAGLDWSQIQEMRRLFLKFRNAGKPVYLYLGALPGNGSYYLASAADKIAMRRVDALILTGLLAEVTMYKGTLDKLGVKADLVSHGKYKSAPEVVTRDSISEYFEEAVNLMMDDFYEVLVNDIASGRSMARDSLLALIDNGPYTSVEAVQTGLVDTTIYPEDFKDWIKANYDENGFIDFRTYSLHPPYDYNWGEPQQIAVLSIEGALVLGQNGRSWLFGETIGSNGILAAIKKCRNDDNIRAVVLRLNTPGGEGMASDIIHHELLKLKEKKPVVVSMGNQAASAGYHIASMGDYIYAEKASITGSIGVIYGKVDFSGLRDKIGFNTYHFKRGKNADFYSSSVGFSEEQYDKINSQVYSMYRDFIHSVAVDRGLSDEYIDSVGQGHVWTGLSARDLKLIDDFGGIWDAVAKARQLSGTVYEDVELVPMPVQKPRFLELSGSLMYAAKTLYTTVLGTTWAAPSGQPAGSGQYYYILPYLLKIY